MLVRVVSLADSMCFPKKDWLRNIRNIRALTLVLHEKRTGREAVCWGLHFSLNLGGSRAQVVGDTQFF